MKITITRNEEEFNTTAAWRIIAQLLEKPNSVIGLSTGQTTIAMHRIVSDIFGKYPFDVSGITLFNVDELTNLADDDPATCYNRIMDQIAGPLGIPPENFLMPPTLSDNFDRERTAFQRKIEERGGADLQLLGIGLNGHIGINEPGTPFESETWATPRGITLGIATIMRSRKLILIAKGGHKAEIVKKALTGPVNMDVPASVVQLHPNCEILLDADAGSLLP